MTAPPRPPPRWKMAIVTWVAIYPTITALQPLIGPHIEAWPLPLRTLLLTGILVPLMVFALVPALMKLCARWLQS